MLHGSDEVFTPDSCFWAGTHQTRHVEASSVEVTNPNPANPQPGRSLLCTSQGQTAKWGRQHIFPACTHNPNESSPRGVNHKALPPNKCPGQAGNYIKRKACQVLLSVPNVCHSLRHTCWICHHSNSCSFTLSIVCRFKVSLFHSHADILSDLYFLCLQFLCHSESLLILKARMAVQRHISQGRVSPQSVTISLWHRVLYIEPLICTALQKGTETMQVRKLS